MVSLYAPYSPPILSNEHKENVLLLMTKSNLVLMDDLCEVFQLHSASKDLLINLVQDLITDNKRKEVSVCIALTCI